MLGWRKLSAWILIFALSAAVAIKLTFGCGAVDIPVNVVDLIKWVTGFFFGANALEHLSKNVSVNLGGK